MQLLFQNYLQGTPKNFCGSLLRYASKDKWIFQEIPLDIVPEIWTTITVRIYLTQYLKQSIRFFCKHSGRNLWNSLINYLRHLWRCYTWRNLLDSYLRCFRKHTWKNPGGIPAGFFGKIYWKFSCWNHEGITRKLLKRFIVAST